MKKLSFILLAIVIVITGIYLFIRFSILKTKNFKPDYSKSTSAIDMRPAIIAKLQQLVSDGSNGLYRLSIGKIEPDVVNSTIDITNATLSPDSARLKNLNSANTLSNEIFKISFSSLHVTGVGIKDVLSKNHLSVKKIFITNPVIEMYAKKKRYNNKLPEKSDSATLYKEILRNIKSISIDTIEVVNGTFINHLIAKKIETNIFNEISIRMNDILIDSSTQYDTKRFLFAKQARISTKKIYGRTPDSLYYYACNSIDIATAQNTLTAHDIELHPRGTKQQFESHLTKRKEMYNLTIPTLTLSGINWWDLTNKKNLLANEAILTNSKCNIFLDRSLPFRTVKVNNFPHQILMKIPFPVSITRMYIRHCNLRYSEFNPGMNKTGTIYIDDMNGEGKNITNIPAQIKKHSMLILQSTGLFMHKIPITTSFHFDLSKYKTGNFTMDLHIGEIDSSTLNPITEPLGEFMIKKGTIQKGIAHVIGNNYNATGNGELLYNNLYLVGLKKKKSNTAGFKKKSIISFFGNLFLIKHNNPAKGQSARTVEFNFKRKTKTTFFSLIGETIFLGILKTVGLPASFSNKPY